MSIPAAPEPCLPWTCCPRHNVYTETSNPLRVPEGVAFFLAQRIKLVFAGGSSTGIPSPAACPAAMDLMSQAILWPRVRITDRPSAS